MKKILQRVIGMVVSIVSFGYNFCYADAIDMDDIYRPSLFGFQELTTENVVLMIIIGVVIAVIVIGAIIMLAKIKKEKDKEKNDKK